MVTSKVSNETPYTCTDADHEPKIIRDAMKSSGGQMNASIIELWMNETLQEAEHLEIPGLIMKPAHKLPLVRYCIDRGSLFDKSVSQEDIDRIYRGLFVYSIGFYEMI